MGTLRELSSSETNTHLVITNSGKVDIYVYDTLKSSCHATLESVYDIESRSAFKEMLELVNVQPYLASKWLFVINYSKVKGMVKQCKGIFTSEDSCFLLKVKNYGEFKEVKELLPNCNDLYLNIIRRNDVMFLLKEFNLSQKVLDFVSSSYAKEPEKVFELKEKLEAGIEIYTNKDVVKHIGASSGSVNKLLFLLLANPPTTNRGLDMVYRKRIQMCVELSNAYGISSLKNFLTASCKDILYIKMLYLEGKVFKTIKDLPDGFDEKKLSRYNIYVERVCNEIPYNRIARLYCMLKSSGIWRNSEDMLDFMYKYYGGIENADISIK